MLINLALQDGFDGDTVLILVDGAEAYRGEGGHDRHPETRWAAIGNSVVGGAPTWRTFSRETGGWHG